MIFKTKAQNLKNLKIKSLKIPKFVFFKFNDYKKNKEKYLKQVQAKLKKKVAVRSSNFFEDKSKKSLAGKFLSLLNINLNSKKTLYGQLRRLEAHIKIFIIQKMKF